MYKKNRILQMLDDGELPLGMQCFTGDPTSTSRDTARFRQYVRLFSQLSS